MNTMNAALVTSYDEPPHYLQADVPSPQSDDDELVDVVAVGLHPRVRSGAAGRHYTSSGELPLIPGVDGVGRRADGKLVYFAVDDDAKGSMADKAIINRRRSIELPDWVDAVKVAAAMNPAMSSWVALRERVPMKAGASVLVLGATGNAGTMAVRIAKRLGAGIVIGAGRNPERLQALTNSGADQLVQLTGDAGETATALAAAAAEVDIVIDYLWGAPTEAAIPALLQARSDRSRPLDWIQIGAIAGPDIQLPSVALRSANLRLQGSGQGAVSAPTYLAQLPSLVAEISSDSVSLETTSAPLAQVEEIWLAPETPGVRTVLIP